MSQKTAENQPPSEAVREPWWYVPVCTYPYYVLCTSTYPSTYIGRETTNIESLYVSKKYLFSKLTIPRFSIVAAKKIDSVTIKKLASD